MKKAIKNLNWIHILQELGIVVFGILIAFSINQCSERIKEKKSLRKSVESIRYDLQTDSENLEKLTNLHTEKAEHFIELKRILNKDRINRKEVEKLILKHLDSPTFYPQLSTYKSMLSNNEISSVKDLELRKSLLNLYESVYERLVYNGQIYDKVHIEKFNDAVLKYFDFESGRLTDSTSIKSAEILNGFSLPF